MDTRHADSSTKSLVNTKLVLKGAVPFFHWLELDNNLLSRQNIMGKV
jgi:hypothetical protein